MFTAAALRPAPLGILPALSFIDSLGNRPQLFLKMDGIFVYPLEQLRLR